MKRSKKSIFMFLLASAVSAAGLFAEDRRDTPPAAGYAALLARAEALYNEAKYEEVIELLAPAQSAFDKNDPSYREALSYLGKAHYYTGQYPPAETCLLEAHSIMEKTLGKDYPDYASSLSWLGMLYKAMGDYAKAEPYYLEASRIYEQSLGKEHSYYATSLNNLGMLYKAMGDYAKAEPYYLEASRIYEQSLGKEHSYYATSLNNLGSLYQAIGDYAKAEPYLLEDLRITEQKLGKDHPDYATSLNNLGSLYQAMGDYAKAEPYLLEDLRITEQSLGKDHPSYAASLNNLGVLYKDMGDYAKAEPYHLEASRIAEQSLGKVHPNYAVSLDNLGVLYFYMGDYAKAETYYLEARRIREQSLGKDHPSYAVSLHNLGLLYQDMGDYAKAETYYLESLRIREQSLGKDHPFYATSLSMLGALYQNMGNYAKAETYHMESLRIQEQSLGKDHPSYALSLNNLGVLYKAMGDYAKAETYHLEASRITEQSLGKDHPDYARSLNNLGSFYKDMGDYAKAETYFLEALRIKEQSLGKDHPDYAASLNALGSLYWNMRDYAKAEPYHLEALRIKEQSLGKDHPDYAGSLNNLGTLYGAMGDYAKAEPYHLESLRIWEQSLGKDHPDYASSLNNLGVLYWNMGDYAKAEPYYLESLRIREQSLGKDHPDYALSLSWLGLFYQNMGDYAKAEAFTREMCELNTRLVNQNFSFLSEQQRNLYWNTLSGRFEGAYSLAHFYPDAAARGLNYNNTLFTKGLLLRTANAVRDAIYSSGDAALIAQYERLGALREQISRLQQGTSADPAYIKTLEEQAGGLDQALTRSSTAFRDLKADSEMRWQDVRAALKEGEAAVEFLSFRLYDKGWTQTTLYAALLLRPDAEAPAWIPLCGEQTLQELLSRAEGRSSSEQARILYDVFGRELYAAVWQPLEQALQGVKTVYYSPSGLLHKIAFNALPLEDGERLVDRYDLNLVSSTREAVHLAKKNEAAALSSAAVYGGIDYDTDAALMLLAAQAAVKSGGEPASSPAPAFTPSASVAAVLSEERTRGRVRGGAWAFLPAAQEEAHTVQTYLLDNRIAAALFEDSSGSEESFRQLSGTKTALIHIATHGFFLPDIERDYEAEERARSTGSGPKTVANPLLRSGLIFSGGNHAWSGEAVEGVEDGILTADEIARLNLLGGQAVILSACQTGLGDVNNSEGVFGLQRAFKLAGVETLIMSLWEVDDRATAMLMDTFYRQWLSGRSKQEAFKAAQRRVRAEYNPAPFYWAAFVMMD